MLAKLKSIFNRRNLTWLVIAVIAIGAIWFFFFRGPAAPTETLTVTKGEFLQQVSSSGTVVASQEVSIAVAQGGLVSKVAVKVGDEIKQGQQLLSINVNSLYADLASAEAEVELKLAEINNQVKDITQVTEEQDVLVENAYRTLLSGDLVATPLYDTATVTAPDISGRYTGPEGSYDIIVYRDEITDADYLMRVYGIEKLDPVKVREIEPTRLGNHGLFISFADDIADYENTQWKIRIPNTKGSSYVENYNAHQTALTNRVTAIIQAKESLREDSGTSILNAQLSQARAKVQSIYAEIEDRAPRAPFDGIITNVHVKVGETISPNQTIVEMMSSGPFQVESYLPEIYVPLVKMDDEADVVLDAYGPEKVFKAKVISVDPAKTLKDGLPTYKTVLELENGIDEVKSGMTANIVITTDKKQDVISIPQGLVASKDGKKFVKVQENGRTVERAVQTGGVSSFGHIEILSGLSAGDIVVVK